MTASDVIGLASQIFPKFANVAIVLSFNLKSEILSRVGVNATIADLGLRTSAKHDEAVVLHLTEVLALIEELYSVCKRIFALITPLTICVARPAALSKPVCCSTRTLRCGERAESSSDKASK